MVLGEKEKNWEERINDAEQKWNMKISACMDKHAYEREALDQELCRKELMKKDIHSSFVRDMLRTEKKLVEGHQYDDSRRVRDIVKGKEMAEKNEFALRRNERMNEARSRLVAKQEEELKQLRMQIYNERQLLLRKREADLSTSVRRVELMREDMRHAHHMELLPQRTRLRCLTPQEKKREERERVVRQKAGLPHGCPASQVSTYRGSQLLLRTQGSRIPVLPMSPVTFDDDGEMDD